MLVVIETMHMGLLRSSVSEEVTVNEISRSLKKSLQSQVR